MSAARELYPEERQSQILRLVNEEGRVSVAELSRRYGVSEVTIRADLQGLAGQGVILRTHGGAVIPPQFTDQLSLNIRGQQQQGEKERIATAAAELISDGDAIFLDTSSSALCLARRLRQFHDLTVLSNSLAVIQVLVEIPGVHAVMIGGHLRRDTLSMTGLSGLTVLEGYNIRIGFFGAHGITLHEGLTDVSTAEAEVKRSLVSRCKQVVALVDATKWGRVGVASFARIADLDQVITDSAADPALLEEISGTNPQVIQV